MLAFLRRHGQLHEAPAEKEGDPPRRLNRYHELTTWAYGKRKGLWVILPFQISNCYCLGVTYMVTGGNGLFSVYKSNARDPTATHLYEWILVFACVELVLSQLPSLSSLGWVSFAGACTAATYCTIVVVLSSLYPADNVSYLLPDTSLANRCVLCGRSGAGLLLLLCAVSVAGLWFRRMHRSASFLMWRLFL